MVLPVSPLDGRDFRHSMGLRGLDVADWILWGDDVEEQLRRKDALLFSQPADVVAIREESRPACDELLELVMAAVRDAGRNADVNADEQSLVSAARLTPDDWCIVEHDTSWRLTAAVVCFPSRWRLADKVGSSLDGIHQPVPGYDDELSQPTNAFFDRLSPSKSFWRLNWTLLGNEELFQPQSLREADELDVRNWTFRVERQTLRSLPVTGAVAFGIRTFRVPAHRMSEHDPEFAVKVDRILATAPGDTLQYKGWVGLQERWREAFLD